MTILELEIEEWWDLIKIVFGVLLMTTALMFVGVLIHEGAHIFVALCLGCKVEYFRFTGFLGAEVGICCGPYLVPIAFAGGFAEGLYILAIRRYTKSQWFWVATLSCWVYAVAEIFMSMPLMSAMGSLTFSVLGFGLAWPRLKEIVDPSDYWKRKPNGGLPVWVPSEHRSYG